MVQAESKVWTALRSEALDVAIGAGTAQAVSDVLIVAER